MGIFFIVKKALFMVIYSITCKQRVTHLKAVEFDTTVTINNGYSSRDGHVVSNRLNHISEHFISFVAMHHFYD